MPKISYFFGISIYLYYLDHNPPHFHVIYNEFEATVSIDTFEILTGDLPNRVKGLVAEWYAMHKNELVTNWNKAVNGEEPNKIEPLK